MFPTDLRVEKYNLLPFLTIFSSNHLLKICPFNQSLKKEAIASQLAVH